MSCSDMRNIIWVLLVFGFFCRFWLGYFEGNDLANDLETRLKIYPDHVGAGLCKHCHEEMSNFTTFLPELYEKKTGRIYTPK